MEITVNVISESFDATLSLAHLSFTIHVDSEMILGNVSEQLRGCLGVDANYSFLYLCGTWDDSIHAIHVRFSPQLHPSTPFLRRTRKSSVFSPPV